MPTSLPPPGAPDALYLIDLSSYVFRAYHAITPLSSPKGEPTHATYGTIAMLQKLVGERKPSHLAVAMDSKTKTFRHLLDARYKATREAAPPDLAQQMERSRQIVEAYRIPIYQCDGVEADDVIATVVSAARKAGLSVVVAGADKDLMQLVGDGVVLWDTMRDKVYGPAEVEEKFGVLPTKIRDLLALMGDTSDNIAGVPGVGAKTAADLLARFDSIDGVYARIGEVPKARIRDLLVQHEADARLSQKLVTLKSDVTIDFSEEKARYGGADFEALRSLYTELGFTRLVAQIPQSSGAAPKAVTVRPLTDPAELSRVVADAREAGRVAIAIETTSPEAMRASIVGIGVSARAGDASYVPIAHRYIGAPKQMELQTVLAGLRPLLAGTGVLTIGHDLKYAEVVLARQGAKLSGPWLDTMLASYLIDPEADHSLSAIALEELGETMPTFDQVTQRGRGVHPGFDEVTIEQAGQYAGGCAEAMLRLADGLTAAIERHGLTRLLQDVELPLARVLGAMEQTGVLVDPGELLRLKVDFEAQMALLERRAYGAAGHEFNVNAPRQLETILFDELGLKPQKRTKTARSTDAQVLEALADDHPLPRILLEHRQLSKLKSTYIDLLPGLVNKSSGRIHTEWGQAVAATGRIASNNPNLQNIPVRTDLGRAIRRAFVAPKGMRLVSSDYSQIELRVLAHLSGDPVLCEAFRTGQDVHTRTAMELFRVSADAVTEEMRRRAKTINFGVIYGMGESTLAKRLSIPRPEAAAFIAAYFERYGRVRAFMEETLEEARRTESVRTLFGRVRLLPDLRSSNSMLRSAAERIAQNTPIQGTAADLLKLAMLRLASPVVPGARMVLTVHDELVFEVPEGDVARAMARVKQAMETVHPDLAVPLVVDVGSGPNWGEIEYDVPRLSDGSM
jgi:DNA polymerase I